MKAISECAPAPVCGAGSDPFPRERWVGLPDHCRGSVGPWHRTMDRRDRRDQRIRICGVSAGYLSVRGGTNRGTNRGTWWLVYIGMIGDHLLSLMASSWWISWHLMGKNGKNMTKLSEATSKKHVQPNPQRFLLLWWTLVRRKFFVPQAPGDLWRLELIWTLRTEPHRFRGFGKLPEGKAAWVGEWSAAQWRLSILHILLPKISQMLWMLWIESSLFPYSLTLGVLSSYIENISDDSDVSSFLHIWIVFLQ